MNSNRPAIPRRFFTERLFAPAFAILVGLIVVIIFWPATRCDILNWDDQYHLTDNPFIQPDSPNRFGHFWTHQHGNLYIPIAYNAWAVIYKASMNERDEPQADVLHGANVIVHTFNAMLVFVLIWRLIERMRRDDPIEVANNARIKQLFPFSAAAIAALFFGLHPLQVESVAWISEFRGLASAFFGLLAMIAYIESTRTSRTKNILWNLFGFLCFTSALLCKPSAAAIPLMLMTIDFLLLQRGWRRKILSILPWIFLSISSLIIMRTLQNERDMIDPTPLWARPFVAGDAIVFYLSKLFWPLDLCADYSRTPQSVMNGVGCWFAWLVPVGLIGILIWCRWWKALACFLLMIFALAPVLGIVGFDFQNISTVADRYMYLALIGPALGISLVLSRYPQPFSFAAGVIAIALMVLLLLDQIKSWSNDESIWNHAFEVNERSVVARANLAARLVESGRIIEGEKQFRDLIKLAPRRVNGYLGLADLAMQSNDLVKAEHLFRQAYEIDPNNTMASSRLGFALIQLNRGDEAESVLKHAIEVNSKNSDAMVNLGALMLSQRRFDESIRMLEQAIREHPHHPQAWVNLLKIRRMTQPDHLAETLIEDVKRLTDNDPWPLRKLARECLLKQEWHDAETLARAALAKFPRHAETINDLAQSLAFQGKVDEAIVEFDRAYKLRPDLTMIGDNLEKARALKARGASASTQSTSNPSR